VEDELVEVRFLVGSGSLEELARQQKLQMQKAASADPDRESEPEDD
jgi:hypothetical protein